MPSKTCYFLSWIMLWACGGYCQLWQLKFLGCILSKTVGVHCFHSSSPAFLALCRRRQFVFFLPNRDGPEFHPSQVPAAFTNWGAPSVQYMATGSANWPHRLLESCAREIRKLSRLVTRHNHLTRWRIRVRTPAELLGSRSSLPSSR
jgi:hypothetical protein